MVETILHLVGLRQVIAIATGSPPPLTEAIPLYRVVCAASAFGHKKPPKKPLYLISYDSAISTGLAGKVCGVWCVVCGVWWCVVCVCACGVRCEVCGVWCGVCGVWCVCACGVMCEV